MPTLLDTLRTKVAATIDERKVKQTELDALLAAPTSEARDLNAAETESFTRIKGELEALDADIDSLEGRVSELNDLEARKAATAAKADQFGETRERAAVIGDEARTYRPDDPQRGVSFLRDVAESTLGGDASAQQRIAQHMQESRAVATSAFAGLTVPQYLTEMVAPAVKAMRPFANICNMHPLPGSGLTVNISRITTGTSAAVQASENSAVSETNIDDTLLTVNVRTISGQQTLSRQALDRSTGAESIVLDDLARAYATELDRGILNDDGTSGTHLGVYNTSSIVSESLGAIGTTAATVAAVYPHLYGLISGIQSGVYMGVSHFVMHPRRWWWFVSNVGTSFPFLQVYGPAAGGERAGVSDTREYGGVVGNIAGVDVVLDGNVPINLALNSGTAEDVVFAVTGNECHLWEEAGSPLFIRAEQTNAASLGVLFVLYGYSAFTAGRYPGANGKMTGAALTTPVFGA